VVREFVEPDVEGEVLVELGDPVRNDLICEMEPAELVAATEGMQVDDLADLVAELPETVTQQLLTADPESIATDAMDAEAPRIAPETPASEVARLFQERDLVSTSSTRRPPWSD
jgi:Mg/Co/Ni transporter MgtE